MTCADARRMIAEDGGIAPRLSEHAAGCPSCRALLERLESLDRILSADLRLPGLNPSFADELWRKIDTLPRELEPPQIAAKKELMLAEYEAQVRTSRSDFWQELSHCVPKLVGCILALGFAAALTAFAWGHASALRAVFGEVPGGFLVGTATAVAAAALSAVGATVVRFANRTPVIS